MTVEGHEPRISIVMPAYNEAADIGALLDELRERGDYFEIIVVDDCSHDTTAEVAENHGARVIRHPYNIGNGAAVKTGIRAARGDIIVLMDADGQHPPQYVSQMVALIAEKDYDMVVGARTRQSDARMHRSAANSVFNYYASYIVGKRVDDLTSGFRAVKAPLLKKFVYLLPNGYSYPTTITIALFRSGFRVFYHPIIARQRKMGKSGVKLLRDGIRFLFTITRLGVLFVPMKIFLPFSILFFSLGFGYGVYQLVFLRRFSNMPPLLISIGIMIFLIGLVAEQIALLRLILTAED